ncbi:hypothetical protein L4174_012940 [Photobacterium sp. CCB-ST2H9]|uniref:hypothetical protein n=1 Tax=Photobacterium sp. CCB-ST2H9 TaxID=2912855 RepID=UPI002003E423|nr:hypothetical protein [Photobacterium sp. CCB-ST2H9]UTM56715.1 hypothetical protein L4174_012940 [Photobacterium sp. CCB-ST2H9]
MDHIINELNFEAESEVDLFLSEMKHKLFSGRGFRQTRRMDRKRKVEFIKDKLKSKKLSEFELRRFIKETKKIIEKSKLDKDQLEFFNDADSRFINWAWSTLKLEIENSDDDIIDYDDEVYSLVNKKHLNRNCISVNERKRSLIDSIQDSNTELEDKLETVEKLKDEWIEIKKEKLNLKWLSIKNQEQCEWAWEYLIEYKYETPHLYIEPTGSVEMYWAIIASIDTWDSFEGAKLFCKSISGAWAQKKYRDNQSDRKQCNYYLSETTISQLREISKNNKISITNVLEKIIAKAYKEGF